jgi:hypothetical protein
MLSKNISAAIIPGIPAFPDDPSFQSSLLSGHSSFPVIPAFQSFPAIMLLLVIALNFALLK